MDVPGPSEADTVDELVAVEGALIIGAGPSGLAVAACLREKLIPYTIVERAECVASLWKHKTYDRIQLHIPKQQSQLPMMAFPGDCPDFPTGAQFVRYLEEYARRFQVRPRFNLEVTDARYLEPLRKWRVEAVEGQQPKQRKVVFHTRWLVVATGENADPFLPVVHGAGLFHGPAFHSSEYRNGEQWRGKRVLVVGTGNSGFEVALDLANHGALPSLNIRSPFHVLPRQMLGRSTFEVAMTMRGLGLPYKFVDLFLVLYAHLVLGYTAWYGIPRPRRGPLERKDVEGITPVLDVGTFKKIRNGEIKVVRGLAEITREGAIFADKSFQAFDAIVWATGFRSSVTKWLHNDKTFDQNGIPVKPFPNSWMGDRGLYTAGFTKRGLLGAAKDAVALASELSDLYDEMQMSKGKGKMKETAV